MNLFPCVILVLFQRSGHIVHPTDFGHRTAKDALGEMKNTIPQPHDAK
jgi:hypothetical protein